MTVKIWREIRFRGRSRCQCAEVGMSQAQVKSRTVNESWEALMISDEAEKQAGS